MKTMSQKFKPTMIAAALTAALSGGAMAQYVVPTTVSATTTTSGTGQITTEIMAATVIDLNRLPSANPGNVNPGFPSSANQFYGTLTQAQESDGSGSNLLVSGEGATIITGWADPSKFMSPVSLVVDGNAGIYTNGSVGSGTTIEGGLLVNSGGIRNNGTLTQFGAANINADGNATTNIGTGSFSSATNIGGAESINTVLGTTGVTGVTTINGAGTFTTQIGGAGASAVTVTSGLSSINTANTGNTIVGNAGNSITATTGNNTIAATLGANSITGKIGNTITATTGNNAMTASAGNNNITASAINNIEAPTNNIGVATSNSINTVGNISTGTTVTERGGNTTLSLVNNTASLTAGSTLATNGITGVTSGANSGGLTIYSSAQTIAPGTSIPTTLSPNGILAGKTYQNKINGNLLVDGNVYINGTLDYVSSKTANTTVIGSTTGVGASILNGATVGTNGGTAIVLKGATGTQTVVDANGKLTNVVGTAAQSTAALTLTNGIGNTHGLVVTETQATLSGGTHSSSLTMSDNGATFSDAQSGAPVQVHGVNDGTSSFDAVNVRQFSGAVASVTAMANIPQVDQDKTYALGVGVGNFMGQTALAAGVTYRFTKNGVFKGSLSSAMGSSNTTTVGVGAAWSY